MNVLIAIFVFIFGLVIGSFLNVLIFRADKLETIWLSRSECMKCKHVLAWYDLFPLFSYLFLRGKCRYCGKKISIQYPIVEAINGVVYLLIYWHFFLSLSLIYKGRVRRGRLPLVYYDRGHGADR